MKCKKCNNSLKEADIFCSRCGAKTRQSSLDFKFLSLILILSAIVTTGILQFNSLIAGNKPTKVFQQTKHNISQQNTEIDLPIQLKSLEEKINNSPSDEETKEWADSLFSYWLELKQKEPKKAKQILLKLIDALLRVSKIEPKNTEVLTKLGQISFEEQIFDKAAKYYKLILEIEPDNYSIRTKLASCYSFLGKFEETFIELEKVLTKDPENFQANAYSSIAYSQTGKKDKAIEYGNRAVLFAPTEEAKKRFLQFLSKLKEKNSNDPYIAIIDSIKQNPIAGQKFLKAENSDNKELSLYFSDFPMEMMPDYAKKKFFSNIKKVALDNKINNLKLLFIDLKSNKVMEQVDL